MLNFLSFPNTLMVEVDEILPQGRQNLFILLIQYHCCWWLEFTRSVVNRIKEKRLFCFVTQWFMFCRPSAVITLLILGPSWICVVYVRGITPHVASSRGRSRRLWSQMVGWRKTEWKENCMNGLAKTCSISSVLVMRYCSLLSSHQYHDCEKVSEWLSLRTFLEEQTARSI